MRLVTLLAGIAATLLVAGCGSTGSDAATAAPTGEPSVVELVAYDMGYEPVEAIVPAGRVEMVLVNEGAAVHNVVIAELDDLNVAEARAGDTDVGTVTLEPGTYTIYCDIPGHRSAGMVGSLIVR